MLLDLGAVRSWLGGGEHPCSEADAGCPELGSHVVERSRARAARELEGTLQSRMVGAKHGPGDGEDDEAVMARPRKSIEKVHLCGIKSKKGIRTSASRPPAGISREIAILRSKKEAMSHSGHILPRLLRVSSWCQKSAP